MPGQKRNVTPPPIFTDRGSYNIRCFKWVDDVPMKKVFNGNSTENGGSVLPPGVYAHHPRIGDENHETIGLWQCYAWVS